MNQMENINATTSMGLGVADEVVAGLRSRLTGLSADTHAGYELVKAGIAEVSKLRTGVEAARKRLVEPHVASQKKTNAEAKRVKEMLLEIETPLREEKARIDDEAERQRKENEEKERLAIEAKELAERETREAEQDAAREVERKQRAAESAKLADERKALEDERKDMEAARRIEQETIEKERQALADEREVIEAEKRAIQEEISKELEAKEAAERAAKDEEARVKTDEVKKFLIAEQEAEQERTAEERKPDRIKLQDFGDRIQCIESPQINTDWGNEVMVIIWDHLQSAVDAAHAPQMVLEQSPSE